MDAAAEISPYSATKLRQDMLIRRIGRVVLRIVPWGGYFFLWAPILVLIVFSFNSSRTNAVWQNFTLDWYKLLLSGQFSTEARFSTKYLVDALQNSMLVAVVSTALSTILGTLVAIGMERYSFRGKRLLDLLLYLPVVIPEITMGLSLLIFFSAVIRNVNTVLHTQFPPLSIVTVIIGHVVFSMPFVAIVVRARLAGMSKSIEEAALDLGANEWRVFRRITLPLLMPGIIAGALLAFTLSLDDFVVTRFTAGPGSTTLPLFVYGMIKFGVNPSINAISTLIVCVSMGLVLGSLILQRNRQ